MNNVRHQDFELLSSFGFSAPPCVAKHGFAEQGRHSSFSSRIA